MNDRIARLERSVSRLRAYALAMTAALGFVLLAAFARQQENDGVLRARGLVIVDDAGRERILLGAPIPEAANRVRTDLARVKAIWGSRFPEQYMDWYRKYRHDTNGLVILDESGFDRIAIGDPTPDPNIGRRIGPATGIAINDAQGFERSGYGLLDVNGTYRVILGLDSARGTEGVALGVFDEGPVGAWINDGSRSVFIGSEPPEDPEAEAAKGFHGMKLMQDRKVVHELNVADGS